MKLTYFQLEPHLTKNLAPVYIISGEEVLLKQDSLHFIRKAAKKAGFNEKVRIAPEAGFDWEQLYTSLYSTSLLAEKRLFEIHFRDSSPNKIAGNVLQEYAEKPCPDNMLVIDIGKIDDKISKSAWFKALEKMGVVISIWPIPREQLPQWIMQRAKKYKLSFNHDAANLLADYVEGNLIAAAQAIEKIYLLRPQVIDTNLVREILTDESRFSIFDFIDTLIAGDTSRTLHILNNLKDESVEPVLILWGITRELRLLADYAQQIKSGDSYEQLFQKQRVFARRQGLVRQFLSKYTAADCWQLLSRAGEIDRIIKGAAVGDVWDSLQVFCLRLHSV